MTELKPFPEDPPKEAPAPLAGIELTEQQKDAVRAVLARIAQGEWCTRLAGAAGTGKTTVTKVILHKLAEHGVRDVMVAAPTGRAASVVGGVTLHSVLYTPDQADDGSIRGWKPRAEPLPFLVIDEGSMITPEMLADIRSVTRQVLIIGDPAQLPPVGLDVNLMAESDVFLTEVHRQAADNPILKLATEIRNWAGKDPAKLRHHIVSSAWDAGRTDDDRLGLIKEFDEIKDFLQDDDDMLIVYTNNARQEINNAVRATRGFKGDLPNVGETVVCLKNSGFARNGHRARVLTEPVLDRRGRKAKMRLRREDGHEDEVSTCAHQFGRPTIKRFDDLPYKVWRWDQLGDMYDFGYALTCHKAQGSQAERVVVYLENALDRMDVDMLKRWAYTAITRPKTALRIAI